MTSDRLSSIAGLRDQNHATPKMNSFVIAEMTRASEFEEKLIIGVTKMHHHAVPTWGAQLHHVQTTRQIAVTKGDVVAALKDTTHV